MICDECNKELGRTRTCPSCQMYEKIQDMEKLPYPKSKTNSRNTDALVRLDLNEFDELVPPTRTQLSERVWLNEC